jgi:hypothetical protein
VRPIDDAFAYARLGLPVFPCAARGDWRKRPKIKEWQRIATTDPAIIAAWWRSDPDALIGVPTGTASDIVVLDIDVKHDSQNGFDSLEQLGHASLPDTPMAHTPSGGLHVYFAANLARELRNSAGEIGPGLDVRGEGGYILVPSAGSGYRWDAHLGIETPLAAAPDWLWPQTKETALTARPIPRLGGLSAYAESALESACRRIVNAPAGAQERTLNAEAFAIGTLAGAGGIPLDFARRALIWAGCQMKAHDPRRPWRTDEIAEKVARALADGQRHPRGDAYAA